MLNDSHDDLEAFAKATADEEPATPKRRRRRRSRPRAKTISMKRITKRVLAYEALFAPPVEGIERPRTRGDCTDMPRPCPFVGCKYHLYLDVNPETGSLKLNFPDLEPWELPHTCALDIADEGARTLEGVGDLINVTRERLRQLEVSSLQQLRAAPHGRRLAEDIGANPSMPGVDDVDD